MKFFVTGVSGQLGGLSLASLILVESGFGSLRGDDASQQISGIIVVVSLTGVGIVGVLTGGQSAGTRMEVLESL